MPGKGQPRKTGILPGDAARQKASRYIGDKASPQQGRGGAKEGEPGQPGDRSADNGVCSENDGNITPIDAV